MGLSLTVPISLFGDAVFKKLNVSFAYCIGAVLVLIGFLILNIAMIYRKWDNYCDIYFLNIVNKIFRYFWKRDYIIINENNEFNESLNLDGKDDFLYVEEEVETQGDRKY